MEGEAFFLELGARRLRLTLLEQRTPRAEDYYFDYAVSIGIPAAEATLLAEYIEKLEEKLKVVKQRDNDPTINKEELTVAVDRAMQYFAEYALTSEEDP